MRNKLKILAIGDMADNLYILKKFAKEVALPVVPNPCPTAGSTKRQYIKELIRKLDRDHRGVKENIFKSMYHVKPDYLLKE